MEIKKLAVLSLVLILLLGLVGCLNDDNSTKHDLATGSKRDKRGEVIVDRNDSVNLGAMVTVAAGTTSADNGSINLNYDIEIGKYEVTYAEFIKFLNSAGVASDGSYQGKKIIDIDNPLSSPVSYDGRFYFTGKLNGMDNALNKDTPVIKVSWYGAVAYCNWLSKQEGLIPAYDLSSWELKSSDKSTLDGYRLPTKKEWEYAARGGANGEATTYAGSNTIDDVAWYPENAKWKPHPVGQKQANELGIYDMSGNVWEWTNSLGRSRRFLCGGSFGSTLFGYLEVGRGRHKTLPDFFSPNYGFRICKTK
ncbi:formylglycine-generating enzyme family protein [Sporohalobacter salinus]|uniref:formylglycine-generating enzyme family protein n=1 Tax=Sporohalobacter salinus TaxID=1494606 RepID=UPI001961D75E|nr:SUMF1/EgtB/PvdO family nonheme iron enzyme [Sporohalobacter salinus]MBM7624262.1 hypothetical protein [Sporohalobacter salinus]